MKNKLFSGLLGMALLSAPVVCLADDKEVEKSERRDVQIEREVIREDDDWDHEYPRRLGDDVERERERIEIRENTDSEREEDD